MGGIPASANVPERVPAVLNIGFAAPSAAVIRSGRAQECWTVTAADVDAWLRTAEVGEAFVYAHGPQLVQGGAAARVADLTRTGDVTPHHKRAADGGFDFLIRRNKVRASRAPVCSPDMIALLVEVQDDAQNHRRCRSNAQLGDALGLTSGQVKALLDKLEAARFIVRRTVATRADPKFRVVTVTATGMTTAGPDGAGA